MRNHSRLVKELKPRFPSRSILADQHLNPRRQPQGRQQNRRPAPKNQLKWLVSPRLPFQRAESRPRAKNPLKRLVSLRLPFQRAESRPRAKFPSRRSRRRRRQLVSANGTQSFLTISGSCVNSYLTRIGTAGYSNTHVVYRHGVEDET